MASKLYGEAVLGVAPDRIVSVDHVMGGLLSTDSQGRPTSLDLHYQSADGPGPRALRLDWPNAMFLLSLLKSMQLDTGTSFPDDPRGR